MPQTRNTSNGVDLGNFSTVTTQETNRVGNQIGNNGGYTAGFGNDLLDTGFVSASDPATLASLYTSLVNTSTGTQVLNFQLRDNTPGNSFYDQYYDFTQGLDASVVNVGSGPTLNPAITPEPSSLVLLATGLFSAAGKLASSRRKQMR